MTGPVLPAPNIHFRPPTLAAIVILR